MLPYITVLGKAIPTYWLCSLLGMIVSAVVAIVRHKRFRELQQVDLTNSAALALIGAIVGARLLAVLTLLPLVVRNFETLIRNSSLLYELLSNGLVFYGGLFGALIVLLKYISKYHIDNRLFFDYCAPLFPLFHSFGRIGCFLTGCCYGKPSTNYGIAFTNSASAPNGIAFFPIQLVCSACNLVLWYVVTAYEKHHHAEGNAIRLYLLLYAIGRFVVEFFRGDTIRGFFLGISTSQWISLVIILFYLFDYLRRVIPSRTK